MNIVNKVRGKNLKSPNKLFYCTLGYVMKPILNHQYNVHYNYITDPRKDDRPFIIVANHASRVDYLYTAFPMLPKTCNFVAGYNEFFRSHLHFIFSAAQVISKKNFVTDVYAVKQIMNIIKKGGRVILFPEGMSSISGHNQPVAIGSGKLLKALGVPVYSCIIKGGYLTNTKYCLDVRKGRVDVDIDLMFSKEDLEKHNADEIQDLLNEKLYHDDFEWNKKERVAFDTHGEVCKNLHQLLYYCPKCHHEFEMHGEKNKLYCKHCGNTVTINDYYDIIKTSDDTVAPETISQWFDLEREVTKKYLKEHPDYYFKEKAKLGVLPKNKYLTKQLTSKIDGEGYISISKNGFDFVGKKHGEDFSFHLDPLEFPTLGMVTDTSKFAVYYDGEFYEILPENKTTIKWLFLVEETHRLNGGKWQDFKFKNK